MQVVTVDELKSNIEQVLEAVEAGNSVNVSRGGRVIAEIKATSAVARPVWKDRPALVELARPNAWSEALAAERAGDDR